MTVRRLRIPEQSAGSHLPPPPPPTDVSIDPVVRIEALRGGLRLGVGSGFWIEGWPSALITARHVVERADAVRIHAKSPGRVVEFHAATVAFPDADPDVAVLCTAGPPNVRNRLVLAAPGAEEDAQILGYPRTADLDASPAEELDAHAGLAAPWLRLDAAGEKGMSGGPLVVRGSSPRLAIGVYVGPRNAGGVFAFATDAELFRRQMFAAATLRNKMMGVPS